MILQPKLNFKEFRVIIEDEDNVRVFLPTRQTRRGLIQKDLLREKTIDVFNSWLARGDIGEREELMVLGSYLYRTLFDDRISQLFMNEFDKVQNEPSTILRLVLEFEPKARHLAEWPWEYIAYPSSHLERGFFIAARVRLILARHVPQKEEIVRGLKPEKKPLRILVVVSKPEGLGKVIEKPVVDAIKDLMNQFPGMIQVKEYIQPTKTGLIKMVTKERPHVVHFIGHGKYTEDTGSLALVDEHNHPRWITDQDMGDLFQDYRPRLVFLHACEGARSESYRSFSGVALQLVYSRVPAVVAMQYQVTNKVANIFATKFYRSLGEGKPVDMAVQEGRLQLGQYLEQDNFSSRAFGSPVVYLQSQDGIILAEPPPPPQSNRPIIPIPPIGLIEDTPCPYFHHPDYGCNGKIRKGMKFCYTCGRRLMQCPNCGEIMGTDIGKCACGYRVGDSI